MPEASQKIIREIFNSSVSDARLIFEFNLFDRSVTQKLWSSEQYCIEVMKLDVDGSRVIPYEGGTVSSAAVIIQTVPLDIEYYCLQFNRLLDGFFMNSMSVLDTLAHQISTLYSFQQVPPDIYIGSIKDMLVSSHPNSEAGKFLSKQLGKPWFIQFKPYRHCTTHENLIAYDDVKVSFDQVINRYKLDRKIKLPDNPQARPFTYNRRREAVSYCEEILKKIKSLVTKTYENILVDIRRNRNVLPIV